MKYADDAINTIKEDLLNRKNFSIRLANTIRSWKDKKSIVIGLLGPWGCGKSSILNMINEQILCSNENNGKTPIIIRFNPWNFSENNQLLRAFFQQLYSEINKIEPQKGKKFKQAMSGIGNAFTLLEKLPNVGDFFGLGRSAIDLYIGEKSFSEQKEEINDIFRTMERKVIIFIDDIDRLEIEEIRMIFRLIKVNADFPNTIYLVAFDRKIVEKALTETICGDINQNDGRRYLEKILQVGFDVPSVEEKMLHDIFINNLSELLSDYINNFDTERWNLLFQQNLKALFTTVRDVKRYINTVSVTLPMSFPEVNIVDFLCIEAIRVFFPDLYKTISENKYLILNQRSISSLIKGDNNRDLLESLLHIENHNAQSIEQILIVRLFPQIEHILQNPQSSIHTQDNWIKDKRICTSEYFDNYFLFGIMKEGISENEIIDLFTKTKTNNKAKIIFENFIADQRIYSLLNILQHRISNLDQDQIKNLLYALMFLVNDIPDKKEWGISVSSDESIGIIMYDLLSAINESDRYNWITDHIRDMFPIYSSIILTYLINYHTMHASLKKMFSKEQTDNIKSLCIDKVNKLIHSQKIFEQKNYPIILSNWKTWNCDEEEFHQFKKSLTDNRDIFIKFIRGFIKDSTGVYSIDTIEDKKHRISLSEFEPFFTFEELKSIVDEIDKSINDEFTKTEQMAFNILKGTLHNFDPNDF